VLQRSLGRKSNLATDLSQRFNAFSPLSFYAAMDAQWMLGTHRVYLAENGYAPRE
jgi:hypothetical protein